VQEKKYKVQEFKIQVGMVDGEFAEIRGNFGAPIVDGTKVLSIRTANLTEWYENRYKGVAFQVEGSSPARGFYSTLNLRWLPRPPVGFNDVPAFDVANRVRDVATAGGGAESGFEKAEDCVLYFRYEDDQRHYGVEGAVENGLKFVGVVVGGRFGPESGAQRCEAGDIGANCAPDAYVLRVHVWRF
jgi:hypothetical protein